MNEEKFFLIENPTEDEVLSLIEKNPHALVMLNNQIYKNKANPFNNPKVIKKAIEKEGSLIKFLFDDKKEPLSILDCNLNIHELCLIAVKDNGMLIEYVPDNFRDTQICTEAVKKSNGSLKFIQKQQTYDLCVLAAKGNGHTLQFAKNEFIDKELCEVAVNSNGSAIRHVPEHLKTNDLILTAIKNDPEVIDFINDQTEEMCLLAIEKAKPYISYKFLSNLRVQTQKVCELMASIEGGLRYINNKTPELCWQSIKLFPLTLRFVPAEIQTPYMCLYSIKIDPTCYSYVKITEAPDLEHTLKNLNRIIEVNKNKLTVKNTISSLSDSE